MISVTALNKLFNPYYWCVFVSGKILEQYTIYGWYLCIVKMETFQLLTERYNGTY